MHAKNCSSGGRCSPSVFAGSGPRGRAISPGFDLAPTGRSKAARGHALRPLSSAPGVPRPPGAMPRVMIAQALISPERAAQLGPAVGRLGNTAGWAALSGLGFPVVRGLRALPGVALKSPVGAKLGRQTNGSDARWGRVAWSPPSVRHPDVNRLGWDQLRLEWTQGEPSERPRSLGWLVVLLGSDVAQTMIDLTTLANSSPVSVRP
jgi:hypothetical protein